MRRFRMALAGGGTGSFIGPVHVMAARLDGAIDLVAGAFSSNPERAAEAGRRFGVAPDRAYRNFREMLEGEALRSDRADFVTIATPNSLHFEMARDALRAGFDVISDKPATATLEQVIDLQSEIEKSQRLYVLTHTYTGYPLVREARELCRSGAIGVIRKVVVEYSQGWLSGPVELSGNRQAAWRTDPSKAGAGGCVGDIGVHAFNLVEYVSGLKISALSAMVSKIVERRELDDDCNVLFRLSNDAPGVLHSSQVAIGESNRLELRIYGSKGSLIWNQETPNSLIIHWSDKPTEVRYAGSGYLGESAKRATRLPSGHPEGYIEAFANIYREIVEVLVDRAGGVSNAWRDTLCGIDEGVRGMRFIAQVLESSNRSAWVELN